MKRRCVRRGAERCARGGRGPQNHKLTRRTPGMFQPSKLVSRKNFTGKAVVPPPVIKWRPIFEIVKNAAWRMVRDGGAKKLQASKHQHPENIQHSTANPQRRKRRPQNSWESKAGRSTVIVNRVAFRFRPANSGLKAERSGLAGSFLRRGRWRRGGTPRPTWQPIGSRVNLVSLNIA